MFTIIPLGVIGPWQWLVIASPIIILIIALYFLIKAIINSAQKQNQSSTTVIIDQGAVNNKTKQCPYCGEEILIGAKKCKHCGEWLELSPSVVTNREQVVNNDVLASNTETVQSSPQSQQIRIATNTVARESNGSGTAGFIFALLSAILSWAPVINFILWFLGLLFSFIGLFKRPRGLAIAGFILSIIDIILIVFIIGAVGGILSSIF